MVIQGPGYTFHPKWELEVRSDEPANLIRPIIVEIVACGLHVTEEATRQMHGLYTISICEGQEPETDFDLIGPCDCGREDKPDESSSNDGGSSGRFILDH